LIHRSENSYSEELTIMEFVRVTYETVRGVQIDGTPQGQTGELLGVQRGHHIFDLGQPVDYTPSSRSEVVAGTSQSQPMVIDFQPAVAFAMAMKKKARSVGKRQRPKQPAKRSMRKRE